MSEHYLLWLLVLVTAGIAVIGGAFWYVRRRLQPACHHLREFSKKCATCGYLAPAPEPAWLRFAQRLSHALLMIQVGKVRYVNKENAITPGPRIITPNHGSAMDPLAIANGFDEPFRYMAARGVFTFGSGLLSAMAGKCGAFAADLTPGKGGPAKDAAVEVLCSGQSVVMFPEGWAWLDGAVDKFKKGAVRIARQAAAHLGKPVYIVPTYMRYGRYPGSWIRKLSPPTQYMLMLLLSPIYRRGLTVVFGKPISTNELPADDGEATEFLREAVLALDPMRKK